jgi:hypothetical protein
MPGPVDHRSPAFAARGVDPAMAAFKPQALANIGKRQPLSTTGVAPNLIPGLTQLISARDLEPAQWLITLMQPVTGKSGVNPWISTFDGGNIFPPGAPLVFTAPLMPTDAVGNGMQVRLRWGAGGAAFETAFDYPAQGGSFSIAAEAVDLNVGFRNPVAAGYASADLVPIVGAFMVPGGYNAEPNPLRWREVPVTLAAVGVAWFAVKPYARRLRITSFDAATRIDVQWADSGGATLQSRRFDLAGVGADILLDVPALATVVEIVNRGAGNATYAPEWHIGLV